MSTEERSAEASLTKDFLLSSIQDQCRDCLRPRLLAGKVIEASHTTENVNEENIAFQFIGYVALCKREKPINLNGDDPCCEMIKTSKCKHDELVDASDDQLSDIASNLVVG